MPYPVSKLLKEKIGDTYKLTSDGSQLLNEILNKLAKKLTSAGKKNYLDAAATLLGPDLASRYDSSAKSNAADAVMYKTASEATKGLGLVFPVRRARGEELGKAIYSATLLQEIAVTILNNARATSVNSKIGKAQIILAISFEKASTMDSTVSNMSPMAQVAWKLGYVAPQPTEKQLRNPKYTDYGMQCILASKGFQAVKTKIDKDGEVVGESGLNYRDCMTVLLFRKRGTGCTQSYQTRNLLTGRCEGRAPCKDYQTRKEDGRCVGRKPKTAPKRKSLKKKPRKSRKSCKRGSRMDGKCKKKPGPKKGSKRGPKKGSKRGSRRS